MPIDEEGQKALMEDTPDYDADDDDLDFGLTGDEDDAKEEEGDAKEEEGDAKEEEGDAKKDGDPTAADKKVERPRKNGHMIPQHRYNYAREKREAAEARATELEAELAAERAKNNADKRPTKAQYVAQIEGVITELDLEIEQARADNDVAKAAKLRGEQRVAERHLAKAEQVHGPDPDTASKQAVEHIRTQTVIESLETDYPMLDEGGESFDSELSEEVMETFEALVERMPRDKALKRAAAYVMKANDITPVKTQSVEKRKTDVKKNLKAAGAQPPDLGNAGMDSHKGGASRRLDVMQMSQEDFEKLGDKEIDELLENSD